VPAFDGCLCCPPGQTPSSKLHVTGYVRKAIQLMAPSLSRTAARTAARTTLTSHLGTQPGDGSFLLVRERSMASTSEYLALHGAFDGSVYERLHQALLALSQSGRPLVLDLRGVRALDEGFLLRLLKVQRDLAARRTVSFQVAADGPLPPLLRRLGLEERFGLEPVKRLPQTQPLTTLPQATQTRRTSWVTNESR